MTAVARRRPRLGEILSVCHTTTHACSSRANGNAHKERHMIRVSSPTRDRNPLAAPSINGVLHCIVAAHPNRCHSTCTRCWQRSDARACDRDTDTYVVPAVVFDASARHARVVGTRMGADFGRVKLHSDARATKPARLVDALAYTLDRTWCAEQRSIYPTWRFVGCATSCSARTRAACRHCFGLARRFTRLERQGHLLRWFRRVFGRSCRRNVW